MKLKVNYFIHSHESTGSWWKQKIINTRKLKVKLKCGSLDGRENWSLVTLFEMLTEFCLDPWLSQAFAVL